MPLHLRWANGVAGSRRNPGREDRFTWNSSFFISPGDIDGYPDETEPESEIDVIQQIIEDLCTTDRRHCQPMSVSLFDIARPAKVKGTNAVFMACYLKSDAESQVWRKILRSLKPYDAWLH
jgi:hypothetical protein